MLRLQVGLQSVCAEPQIPDTRDQDLPRGFLGMCRTLYMHMAIVHTSRMDAYRLSPDLIFRFLVNLFLAQTYISPLIPTDCALVRFLSGHMMTAPRNP